MLDKLNLSHKIKQSYSKYVTINIYFQDIPAKVFDILDARIHNDRSCLIFPVKHHNNIIGYKEITVGGYESTFPSQGCQGLIIVTSKRSKGKKEAVLVTSIQDMLALVVAKTSQDIICLPHG